MPRVYFSLFDLKLKVAEITSSRDESSRELRCSVNAKLFYNRFKKSVFLQRRSEDVPLYLLHIQQHWGYIIYFMVGPWLLPTCDWWLRAIRSPANTHWACTKVAEEEKRKFHLFSKSSFEQEAIKREGGDVCRYRGRMAGLSWVASSISTPGWAANGPFTCSCPGLSQPSNDTQPGSEHFFPLLVEETGRRGGPVI